MLEAAECPGVRSGEGDGSEEPNGSRTGRLFGRRCCSTGMGGITDIPPGVSGGEPATVDKRVTSTIAGPSLELARLELLRGIVGTRFTVPAREGLELAREPIRLGSSMPPTLTTGPNIGGMSEIRFI